ncbi:MAG TPA: phosphoribosylformylglycinamidine synthase subunit PurQ [Melioribacteraceae bacterium]|nr:phosphoribosylformylglycinamidine synthase subunit PurQ [Melioribacteraceae bacterium]
MKPKFGVVVFPGSNCDYDAYYSVKKVLGYDAEFLWHKEKDLKNCDAVILPGGFSYGDYLRTGAIARFSPILDSVVSFAEKGGIVFGICNGFQILLEAGLLPGVMLQNESLKFVCKDIYLKVENKETIFTKGIKQETIKIPIKHGEGNYFTDEETLKELKENGQIIFTYSSHDGHVSHKYNPNGSLHNIAGISNKRKNVMGMMPHPENACDPILRKTDGALIFKSIASHFK